MTTQQIREDVLALVGKWRANGVDNDDIAGAFMSYVGFMAFASANGSPDKANFIAYASKIFDQVAEHCAGNPLPANAPKAKA